MQVITKANKQMHDQQDMVKALKSKMLMCDVAYEQQAQKGLAGRKAKMEKEIAEHWEGVEKDKMKEYDAKMQAKLEEEYKLKMTNAKAISDQLDNFKLSYIKQLKEEMLEGELIKRQVQDDLEREKQKELARQQKVAELRADLNAANKDQLKLREVQRIKDLEDDARIDLHSKKREALENMKKEREEARFKDKQDERQRMIDRQIEELRNLKDN